MGETVEMFGPNEEELGEDDSLEASKGDQLEIGSNNIPKALEFGKLVFKKGLNWTVRVGDKWAKPEIMGQILPITDQDGVSAGTGVITHMMVCNAADIPKCVFTDEHDKACKNPIVLMDTLRKIYGNEVNGSTQVVCIGFEPYLDSDN